MTNTFTLLSELRESLAHLLLPRLCEGCRVPLIRHEQVLCMSCLQELPQTGFHDRRNNEASLRIAGRIPYEFASAFAYFSADGLLQHLLHRLKYDGRKEVGHFLGKQAGYVLKDIPWIHTIDAIVPVPLHAKKQAGRGFNQTTIIAGGLHTVLKIPVMDELIIRNRKTESQTSKSREERVQNVQDAFSLNPGKLVSPQHILLMDDVLTTGATLEAAAAPLLQIPGLKISVLTIGIAML